MKAITKNTFKTDILDSKRVVLADVWAPWCSPCRGMEPVLESLEGDVKDWADVVKINADDEMELVQELGVSGLPTFLIFKEGQVVGSTVGVTPKASLMNLLQQANQ